MIAATAEPNIGLEIAGGREARETVDHGTFLIHVSVTLGQSLPAGGLIVASAAVLVVIHLLLVIFVGRAVVGARQWWHFLVRWCLEA